MPPACWPRTPRTRRPAPASRSRPNTACAAFPSATAAPAPQLSLAYDAPQGWYAGAFAAPRLALGERTGVTQLVAYGGYARRLASGLSWEAGASSTAFPHAAEYNYREF